MSQYMLVWKSHDPKVSTSMFASGVLNFGRQESDAAGSGIDGAQLVNEIAIPQNIKPLLSVHVVGQPTGFLLLQASPEEIHQLILALPPDLMEVTVFNVINDAEAKQAMQTRNSAYKLK